MMKIDEIRQRKKKLKLTTYQLALLADLPQGTVSKILTGETKNLSYLTITCNAAVLCGASGR